MHEMSLCESILHILEEQAQTQQYQRVKTVRLTVGQLAGVETAALRFGFDVVIRGTLAEGAHLEIIDVPGQVYCFACGETGSVTARYDPCPHCGSHQLHVTGGAELKIKELEVE